MSYSRTFPELLSTSDNAFGCFLGALVGSGAALVPARGQRWTNAGMVDGPERTAAWAIRDAQHHGVPQRRRRVFVLSGRAGDFRPAQVLFKRESLRGNLAKGREAREDVANSLGGGSGKRGWCNDLDGSGAFISEVAMRVNADCYEEGAPIGFEVGPSGGSEASVAATLDARCKDGAIRNQVGMLAMTLNAKGGAGRIDGESEAFVTHSLRGEGFDASEDGTGRGTPLVPVGVTIHGTDKTASVASFTNIAGALRARAPGGQENSSTTAVMTLANNVVKSPNTNKLQGNISNGCTPETDTSSLLSLLLKEVGAEAFTEWGSGVFDSLQPQKILRSEVHGDGVRCAPEPVDRLGNESPTRKEDSHCRTLRKMREAGRARRSPQGRRLPKQLSIQLTAYLSKLPQPSASMQSGVSDLREADEGIRLLRHALSTLQEMGRPTDSERQSVCSGEIGDGQQSQEPLPCAGVSCEPSCERLLRSSCDAGSAERLHLQVRRLTPTECARLMGFPDNHCDLPGAADGPKYKAYGNSMAVPVIRAIGLALLEVA